ncbi:MAG: TIGR00730 family Rossman fold protein [Bdellovibrionales bacterium]|jgi:uncharacterized protein (TIGR00730 family)|nr:TIGR00730 family Rossman fold protein [Bdellovibrionales bacterium]
MKYICVYCGSNLGNNAAYQVEAKLLAKSLVENNLGLVYGGSNIGIMNIIASEVLSLGGEVLGVTPKVIYERGLAKQNLTALHKVDSMHERKLLMEQLAHGFITFPGGFGTLDELCEIVTWAQLEIHSKPCGLLNFNSYFKYFLLQIEQSVQEGFIKAKHAQNLIVQESAIEIVKAVNKRL